MRIADEFEFPVLRIWSGNFDMAYLIGDIFDLACKGRAKYLLAQSPKEPIRITKDDLGQGLALMSTKCELRPDKCVSHGSNSSCRINAQLITELETGIDLINQRDLHGVRLAVPIANLWFCRFVFVMVSPDVV